MSNSRIERARHEDLEERVDQLLDGADPGSISQLVVTATVTTYPTSATSYFAVHPCVAGGDETEGTAASYTADTDQVFYAVNLGTQIPPVNTHLVVHAIDNRWAFRYDG